MTTEDCYDLSANKTPAYILMHELMHSSLTWVANGNRRAEDIWIRYKVVQPDTRIKRVVTRAYQPLYTKILALCEAPSTQVGGTTRNAETWALYGLGKLYTLLFTVFMDNLISRKPVMFAVEPKSIQTCHLRTSSHAGFLTINQPSGPLRLFKMARIGLSTKLPSTQLLFTTRVVQRRLPQTRVLSSISAYWHLMATLHILPATSPKRPIGLRFFQRRVQPVTAELRHSVTTMQ